MKNAFRLFTSISVCELVGIVGTPFTISAIPSWYAVLNKPFFAPPNWIFGPVWTLLYLMMGISFYLIWQNGWEKKTTREARKIFFIQLGLNCIWTPIFFGLRSPALGLVVIIALWGAIVMTIRKILPISKIAAYLLIPYLLWVSFATLLNAGILLLN